MSKNRSGSANPAGKHWYLVAYDIRDEARLRRVARVLEGYGVRLQYSLFRCRLSERGVEHLRWQLAQVTRPEDGLLIAGLCQNCVSRLRQRDTRGDWPEEAPDWVVV